MPGLMDGKRGLVMGVANDHSIAWGIAKTLAQQGAKLAFTYQGDALAKCPVTLRMLHPSMLFSRKSKSSGARWISSCMPLRSPTKMN